MWRQRSKKTTATTNTLLRLLLCNHQILHFYRLSMHLFVAHPLLSTCWSSNRCVWSVKKLPTTEQQLTIAQRRTFWQKREEEGRFQVVSHICRLHHNTCRCYKQQNHQQQQQRRRRRRRQRQQQHLSRSILLTTACMDKFLCHHLGRILNNMLHTILVVLLQLDWQNRYGT